RKLELYRPKEVRKKKRTEIKFDVTTPVGKHPRDCRTSVAPSLPHYSPVPIAMTPRTTNHVIYGKMHYQSLVPPLPPSLLRGFVAAMSFRFRWPTEFCTEWPAGLETDEKCEEHFPVEVTDSDYCHSSPTIRDVRSRIVTLKIKLSRLQLDYHAKDKLLRLVKDRYDPATDILTIVTDRCPLKKQNYDYAHYLLTAVFHESWKTEPWEADKEEADMECFLWEKSRSEANLHDFVRRMRQSLGDEEAKGLEHIQRMSADCLDEEVRSVEEVEQYAEAVCEIHNGGESDYAWEKYKKSVCSLLGLGRDTPVGGEVQA
ncbi:ribosomal protein S28, putative, partial [Ixodes scapularis]